MLFLVDEYAGHSSKICSGDSRRLPWWQVGKVQRPSGFEDDQCLVNFSHGYWELRKRSWILTLETSYGLGPADVQSLCGEESDRNSGWKYFKDGSSSASDLSLISQKSTTFDLTNFLKVTLASEHYKSNSGWGSWYMRRRFLTWTNHDLEDVDEVSRICWASLFSGSPGRWQIIQKSESCLRCKIAVAGREPLVKYTREAGELTLSFKRFWSVLLYCWSRAEISCAERTRLTWGLVCHTCWGCEEKHWG